MADKKTSSVAIITRTKDREVFLERAINSVLGQSFQNWCHVIVNDGGSQDAINTLTNKYIKQYHNRLLLITHNNSLGMEAASNAGILATNSDYIAIHDDDDSWSESFLSETVKTLDENKVNNFAGVITHCNLIYEKMKEDKIIKVKTEKFHPCLNSVSITDMTRINQFMPISFLYKRSVIDEIGLYNAELPVIGDWEFNLRFLIKYDIIVIKKNLANYHVRKNNVGVFANSVVANRDDHELYRTLLINHYIRSISKNNSLELENLMIIGNYLYKPFRTIYRIEKLIDRLKNYKIIKILSGVMKI